jgi:hypothetical protein
VTTLKKALVSLMLFVIYKHFIGVVNTEAGYPFFSAWVLVYIILTPNYSAVPKGLLKLLKHPE